ncbi:hypothetical protein DICVIV_11944 [Dictyocaulus viviparus]|uniref:Uncharacterized protein n=1 Tax=Dictyocaulus viviparus TaxID=29172 RepID=A0A0D8XBV3_DICVI|nr:hypothetical protein DICVIV_11944 [Dictyocaulus viviparus]
MLCTAHMKMVTDLEGTSERERIDAIHILQASKATDNINSRRSDDDDGRLRRTGSCGRLFNLDRETTNERMNERPTLDVAAIVMRNGP